ncbi:hypothetical protein ACE02U_18450 [Shewanella xiamenensis]|uniref:hypothetical protein n=1 Tax=Shewanella TaxID=22 RepID=UPI0010572983|nr:MULTISPECIES: hypothetical protein [Shewanella]UML93072.1 hypothetical protein MKD32_16820 [Shewanella xiamenensis]
MDWKSAHVNDEGLVKVPESWLQLHYYEALNILFRFENSLRVFVYIILKMEKMDSWDECSFKVGGNDQQSIKSIASKRINQARNFGYLGFEVMSPLMHLTSGELVEIITADAYWPIFKKHFKGNKDIIKNKLLEIGTVRNSLAHFRPLKPEDLELIKLNSRHTLMGVEDCLKNVFNIYSNVPTNTADDWYKCLKMVKGENISVSLTHSKNEEWVCVKFSFNAPQFKKGTLIENFYSFELAKIKPDNILKNYPELKKHIIYMTETVKKPELSDDHDIRQQTSVNICFSIKTLQSCYEVIIKELNQVISDISEECKLIASDGLARGKIIESANSFIYLDKSQKEPAWEYLYQELKQVYEPEHSVEYWGEHNFATSDVVGDCQKFPWMESKISNAIKPY